MAHNGDDDGNGLGGVGGDRLAAILVHVGAARKGILRLEGDVKDIKNGLDDLRARAATKADCDHKHDKVDEEIRDMRRQLEVKGYPAARPTQSQVLPAFNPEDTGPFQIPPAPAEPESPAEKIRKSITFWLTTIIAAASILGTIVFGLIKIGRYVDRLDRALELSTRAREPAAPDAAVPPQHLAAKKKVPAKP